LGIHIFSSSEWGVGDNFQERAPNKQGWEYLQQIHQLLICEESIQPHAGA